MAKLNIDEVNTIDIENFVNIFSNVVESYNDAAKAVFSSRPFKDVETLCKAFSDHLENISIEDKLKVLRLHPILAGKQADKGELTKESTEEQKAAKLNALDESTKGEFNTLNARYVDKFGFPFIICARENTASTIAEQLSKRLNNSIDEEAVTGINEVKKICRLRILSIVIS
ncbi:2-oxo-4-hydroxy-4-carboxy-5-ureidoimidazoline decarboxylase-like isoform X2 [Arctopsyche grandis]